MAVPRVFISSTYYDLKEVRNTIGNFVLNLGYEPIMHERSSVAYTHNKPLEEDCYHELSGCDIAVCVIGSKFGSQSSSNDLSITMNEINNAISLKKKVYIFIARDMFIENRTYEQNRSSGSFKSAYTEDLRVHEFISDLRNNLKVHVVSSFDTTDDIVATLKLQFAGLFQNLLAKDANVTESKTAYDLQKTTEEIRDEIKKFSEEKEAFFSKFDCTLLGNNLTLTTLKKYLGFDKAAFFASDIDSLDEIMRFAGYSQELAVESGELYIYTKEEYHTPYKKIKKIVLKDGLFDEDLNLLPIRKKSEVDENLIYSETEEINEDDLPF